MNFKKNGLLLAIVIAMFIGIVFGAIINSNKTDSFKQEADKMEQTYKENPKALKIVKAVFKKAEKDSKKETASNFNFETALLF